MEDFTMVASGCKFWRAQRRRSSIPLRDARRVRIDVDSVYIYGRISNLREQSVLRIFVARAVFYQATSLSLIACEIEGL